MTNKEGWLVKQSRHLSIWRKRYTILQNSKLSTYKTDAFSSKEMTECIDLTVFHYCYPKQNTKLQFTLKSSQKANVTFTFKATSYTQKIGWITAINSNIYKLNSDKLQTNNYSLMLTKAFIRSYYTLPNQPNTLNVFPDVIIQLIHRFSCSLVPYILMNTKHYYRVYTKGKYILRAMKIDNPEIFQVTLQHGSMKDIQTITNKNYLQNISIHEKVAITFCQSEFINIYQSNFRDNKIIHGYYFDLPISNGCAAIYNRFHRQIFMFPDFMSTNKNVSCFDISNWSGMEFAFPYANKNASDYGLCWLNEYKSDLCIVSPRNEHIILYNTNEDKYWAFLKKPLQNSYGIISCMFNDDLNKIYITQTSSSYNYRLVEFGMFDVIKMENNKRLLNIQYSLKDWTYNDIAMWKDSNNPYILTLFLGGDRFKIDTRFQWKICAKRQVRSEERYIVQGIQFGSW